MPLLNHPRNPSDPPCNATVRFVCFLAINNLHSQRHLTSQQSKRQRNLAAQICAWNIRQLFPRNAASYICGLIPGTGFTADKSNFAAATSLGQFGYGRRAQLRLKLTWTSSVPKTEMGIARALTAGLHHLRSLEVQIYQLFAS
jgi:hypothetical protein